MNHPAFPICLLCSVDFTAHIRSICKLTCLGAPHTPGTNRGIPRLTTNPHRDVQRLAPQDTHRSSLLLIQARTEIAVLAYLCANLLWQHVCGGVLSWSRVTLELNVR